MWEAGRTLTTQGMRNTKRKQMKGGELRNIMCRVRYRGKSVTGGGVNVRQGGMSGISRVGL